LSGGLFGAWAGNGTEVNTRLEQSREVRELFSKGNAAMIQRSVESGESLYASSLQWKPGKSGLVAPGEPESLSSGA